MIYINTHERCKQNHRINDEDKVERKCSKCNEWKIESSENFYMINKKNQTKGFMSECKKCSIKRTKINTEKKYDEKLLYILNYDKKHSDKRRERRRKYYKLNKDKEKETHRLFLINNPEKSKQYSKKHRKHNITSQEWLFNQIFFNYKCAYCGKTKEAQLKENKQQFHKDHINHIGSNDVKNCCPSCTQCNTSKGRYTIDELIEYNIIKSFNKERYDKIISWINKEHK